MSEQQGDRLEDAKERAALESEQSGEPMLIYHDPELDAYEACAHSAIRRGGAREWVNPLWIVWSSEIGNVTEDQWDALYRRPT